MVRSRTRATNATARTRISQTLGPKRKRAAGGAAPPSIVRRLTILVIVTILPVLAFSAFMIVNYSQDTARHYMQQFQATARATSLAIDVRDFATDTQSSRRSAIPGVEESGLARVL